MRDDGRRLKGDRVYMLFERGEGESLKRFATVVRDDIPGWDMTDVVFDDLPALTMPVVAWYLFDEDDLEARTL